MLNSAAATALGVPIELISLIDDKREWFTSRFGLSLQEIPRNESFCAHAIVAEDMLVVADATQDQRFSDNHLVVGDPHVRFYAAVPLRTTDGLALGTLCILASEPRPGLSLEQAGMLRDLAALTVALIESGQEAQTPHPVTRLPDQSRFLKDIEVFLDNRARAAPATAVRVIDAATPNECASADTGTLGSRFVRSCDHQSDWRTPA